MKKTLSALIMMIVLSIAATAQHCQDFDSIVATAGSYTTPGFVPTSANLPCIIAGTYVSDTIYFTNYSTISGFPVDSVTIDSIGGLPNGLCWVMDQVDNKYGAGQNGILYISGTCMTEPGQYKLQIFLEETGGINIPPYSNAERATGLKYYMRVACPGAACQPVDTMGTLDSLYTPYVSQLPCGASGIQQLSTISGLMVSPNPFSSATDVSLYSAPEGPATVRLTDMLGHTIWSRERSLPIGKTDITIDRQGLAAGIYTLSLTSQGGYATVRLSVE